jgi:hypothetical protein
VDRGVFVDYDKKISRPMDLGWVRRRIASGHYDVDKRPSPDPYDLDLHQDVVKGLLEAQKALVDIGDEDGEEGGGEAEAVASSNSLSLLEIVADRRGGVKDKVPDCGQCAFCLDKPKYGGYHVLKARCINKQPSGTVPGGWLLAGRRAGRQAGNAMRLTARACRRHGGRQTGRAHEVHVGCPPRCFPARGTHLCPALPAQNALEAPVGGHGQGQGHRDV